MPAEGIQSRPFSCAANNKHFVGIFQCARAASCAGKVRLPAYLRNRLLHYLHLLNATNRCSITVQMTARARIALPKLIK